MKPNHTISNDQVSETKQSKDRVTILLTCNATRNEKLAPLFIHKYENPQVLKNINKKTLPVDYYWNKKSWMQVSIWNDYIKKLNNRMIRQSQKILLLIDNVPTHALYETTQLTNITIKHLPLNTMTHLQPCDQGIINSFKVRNIFDLNILIFYTLFILNSNLTCFRHNIESSILQTESNLLTISMIIILNLQKLILRNA